MQVAYEFVVPCRHGDGHASNGWCIADVKVRHNRAKHTAIDGLSSAGLGLRIMLQYDTLLASLRDGGLFTCK